MPLMRKSPELVIRSVPTIMVLLCLVTAFPAGAQPDFSCLAEVNRTTVPQGGNIILTVSAEGDLGWSADFQLPDIAGVRVQSGGTNQSMSVINGKARTAVSRTWYLTVQTDRDFTIAPVTIISQSGECKTKPISVKVTAPVPPKSIPPATTGNRVPAPSGGSTDIQSGRPGDEIFLTLDVDHEEAWVGQQIILTFRYWRRIPPWNNPSYKDPRTEGFWRETLGEERRYTRRVQGMTYTVREVRYSLFPTRSGDLVIEPAEISFPEGVFDRFFNSRRSHQRPSVLRTRSIVVKVKDLPSPRPAGFSGIVASRVSLQASVDRDSVPRGEAVGLKVILVADGFLKGFSGLNIPAPENARLHDASENFRSLHAEDRISGEIIVEKVIIPAEEGLMTIAPLELSWFDSARGEYRVARTPSREIRVTPSDLPRVGDDSSGFLRNQINRLGEDLAFVHPVPERLGRRLKPWLGSLGWWMVFLMPAVLLGLLRILLHRMSLDRKNPAARRLRLSLVTARSELTKATESKDPAAGLAAVARSITGFVADCTDQPLASVQAVEVMEYCHARGLSETGVRLVGIMEECDSARYGGGRIEGFAGLASEVGTLLEGLDEARKKRREPGEVSLGLLAAFFLLVLSPQAAMAAEPDPGSRPGTDPVRLVAEGNQAYTEGSTEQALELYLQAQAQGVNDPALHFNLGNTYARRGELGHAVASYLRAKRLDPRDRDTRTNLAWVRQHIKDLELTDNELPLFIAQAAGIISALTLDQWGIVLVLATWLVAALIGWAWYREVIGVQLRRALLAGFAFWLVAGTVTVGRWYQEQVRDQAVVIVEMAEVRSGPAQNFPVLFQVHDGLTVNIEGEREGWVRVGLGGEWVGWLPAASVTAVRIDPKS